MTIEKFLQRRIRDMRTSSRGLPIDVAITIEGICNSYEAIIRWHDNWPVMVNTMPELTVDNDPESINNVVYRMTQQIDFITQKEYIERFGAPPPTTPVLKIMASAWSTHPEFKDEWRI